jgi:hypothetical protein
MVGFLQKGLFALERTRFGAHALWSARFLERTLLGALASWSARALERMRLGAHAPWNPTMLCIRILVNYLIELDLSMLSFSIIVY